MPDENGYPEANGDSIDEQDSALKRRDCMRAMGSVGLASALGGLGAGAVGTTAAQEETDPSNLDLYLLFGQSNMEGAGPIEPQDRETDPRIHLLADMDCPNLGREYGEWYLAEPPLNRCDAGIGPGDYFAKTMIEEMPEDGEIGLVPAAVGGADIALFQKGAPIGRNDRDIPPQFDGGYQWLLDLAQRAQEVGTIKGILFHQGETNTDDEQWKYDVQGIVENLRSDLGIGDVPFLAGELLYDEQGGCCASHNAEINQLPDVISNAHVVSAEGLEGQDYAHFTTEAYREFGRRYAEEMLNHVDVGSAGGGNTGDGNSGDSNTDGDTDGDDNTGDAPTWNSDDVYTEGDRVSHNGSVWEAQWWTQNQEPGASQWGPWEEVSDSGSSGDSSDAGSGDSGSGNSDSGDSNSEDTGGGGGGWDWDWSW